MSCYVFVPEDGPPVLLGEIQRPDLPAVTFFTTDDPKEARYWETELRAGRLPKVAHSERPAPPATSSTQPFSSRVPP